MLVLAGAGLGARAWGQEDRPQIMPGERKSTQKKDEGPRAIAVLRQDAKGKSTLIPIAILIDGKFWDASAYKADPVPMALEPGTVYEAEKTGNSVGLFTIGSALHSRAANVTVPWLATGAFQPIDAVKPKATLKAETAPAGIVDADAPPRLTRTPGASAAGASSSGGTTADKGPAASKSDAGSAPAQNSDDDRPRLKRPTESSPSANTSAPTQTPAGESKDGKNESKADAKADSKGVVAAVVPASDSGASEENRPRLRRGKPAISFADEDVEGYARAEKGRAGGAKAGEAKVGANAADILGANDDSKLIPAISDAKGPEPHTYTFDFYQTEQDDRLKQMTAMAKDQVRAYLQKRARATTSATAAKVAHPAGKKTSPVKGPEPILENVKMTPYDLWSSNVPVLVFSADAHMPPTSGAHGETAPIPGTEYSILLVAYPDIYGTLRMIHAQVTDKFHLDVTPRLELVDAVDADGDGRGELLFRETSDLGAGWVIYRASADKLYKIFDSLNSE